MITDLDVLVIGAGSAGEAASELGVELGARVAVVERDLVGLGGSITAALLGPDVDEHRAVQLEHSPERLEQSVDVVAGDDTDIADPEILEELPGGREVDDRSAQPPAPHQGCRPDDRDLGQPRQRRRPEALHARRDRALPEHEAEEEEGETGRQERQPDPGDVLAGSCAHTTA